MSGVLGMLGSVMLKLRKLQLSLSFSITEAVGDLLLLLLLLLLLFKSPANQISFLGGGRFQDDHSVAHHSLVTTKLPLATAPLFQARHPFPGGNSVDGKQVTKH